MWSFCLRNPIQDMIERAPRRVQVRGYVARPGVGQLVIFPARFLMLLIHNESFHTRKAAISGDLCIQVIDAY